MYNAYTALGQSAQTFPGSDISGYLNPYSQGVTDIAAREAQRTWDVNRQQINDAATRAGAFGGSRHGIAEAEGQRNLNTQLSDIYLKGGESAFRNAAQLFNADQDRLLKAGTTYGALAGQDQAYGLKDAAALQAVGEAQQGQGQKNLDLAYQNFVQQRDYPREQVNWLSNIIKGTSLPSGSTTTGQQLVPQTSPLAQVAGLATTGLGLYGLINGLKKGGRVKSYRMGGRVRGYADGGTVWNGAQFSPGIWNGVSSRSLMEIASSGNTDPIVREEVKRELGRRSGTTSEKLSQLAETPSENYGPSRPTWNGAPLQNPTWGGSGATYTRDTPEAPGQSPPPELYNQPRGPIWNSGSQLPNTEGPPGEEPTPIRRPDGFPEPASQAWMPKRESATASTWGNNLKKGMSVYAGDPGGSGIPEIPGWSTPEEPKLPPPAAPGSSPAAGQSPPGMRPTGGGAPNTPQSSDSMTTPRSDIEKKIFAPYAESADVTKPYDTAKVPEADKLDEKASPWMAITKAGLSMMAAKPGQSALAAIGEGGLSGLDQYGKDIENARKNKQTNFENTLRSATMRLEMAKAETDRSLKEKQLKLADRDSQRAERILYLDWVKTGDLRDFHNKSLAIQGAAVSKNPYQMQYDTNLKWAGAVLGLEDDPTKWTKEQRQQAAEKAMEFNGAMSRMMNAQTNQDRLQVTALTTQYKTLNDQLKSNPMLTKEQQSALRVKINMLEQQLLSLGVTSDGVPLNPTIQQLFQAK